jgi:hypothetical protein
LDKHPSFRSHQTIDTAGQTLGRNDISKHALKNIARISSNALPSAKDFIGPSAIVLAGNTDQQFISL